MNYREIEGLNQSLLKTILISPKKFKQTKDTMYQETDNSAFRFGTLVDIMITEPDTDINDLYIVSPDITIHDNIKPILNDLAKIPNYTDEDILSIANNYSYCTSMKDETRINRIKVENYNVYIDFVKNSNGKTIISQEEYNNAITCKMSLFSNEFTKEYFNKDKYEVLYKVVIQSIMKDVKCKFELDMVSIDHENKVIHPIDLKTTSSSVHSFVSSFWKYRYDFQAAIYKMACTGYFKNLLEKGYTINNFKFIVMEKTNVNPPMVFEVSDEVNVVSLRGGKHNNFDVKGIQEAFERYKWHTEKDLWEYPMEYYRNKRIII